jgi:TolA-binding protein
MVERHPGFVGFGLIIVLVTMFLSLGIPVKAEPLEPAIDLSAEQVLQFAHHLFSQEEYFRAIGEYQRFLFLYPDNPEAPTAELRIAQCYIRGKRWQQALEAVDNFLRDYPENSLKWQALFMKARALNELGRGEEARGEYGVIIEARPESPLVAEAWYLIGLSYAKEGRWLEADEALRQVGSGDLFYGAAKEVLQIVAEESKAKRKDPSLAGILAAVVPGAGHLYCERPGDAAIAFVFTGAFAWATYEAFNQDHEELGVGLGLITLAFYAGNIFSAVNVAHKYNDRVDRRQQERLAPYRQTSFHRNRVPAVGLALKFSF